MNDSQKTGEKKVGPIVATLIIVLILIIAALYLFASKMNQPATPTDATTAAQANDLNSIRGDLTNSTSGLDTTNF